MTFNFLSLIFRGPSQMEEDPFNPDYVEVDRVLEVSYCEDKDTGEVRNENSCSFGNRIHD